MADFYGVKSAQETDCCTGIYAWGTPGPGVSHVPLITLPIWSEQQQGEASRGAAVEYCSDHKIVWFLAL